MAESCDSCMYLGSDFANVADFPAAAQARAVALGQGPVFQCLQTRPPVGAGGRGVFPVVEPVWWCGQWGAWQAVAISVNAGDNQTAPAGEEVLVAPSVLVTDNAGRPVFDVEVVFAVTSGGGIITGAGARTNRLGIATVGSWTMGDIPGANALSATAGVAGPIAISATGEALIISLNGGDGQVAPVSTVLPIPPSVLVTDGAFNPLAGVAVVFAITGGGGSVQDPNAVTDINGIAQPTSWTLGGAPGPNTLDATAGRTAAGSPVPFTATGT
jgi:hypothetical protein